MATEKIDLLAGSIPLQESLRPTPQGLKSIDEIIGHLGIGMWIAAWVAPSNKLSIMQSLAHRTIFREWSVKDFVGQRSKL